MDKKKIATLFKRGLSNQEIESKLGFKISQVSGQTRRLKKNTELMAPREEALAGKMEIPAKDKAKDKKK